MRHGIAGNKLNRNSAHRKATIRDIAKATIVQERICTTKAKAKEARKLVDKLITMGKKGTLAEKRRAFAILCDHKLVSNLFNDTASRFKNRAGGYTRIIPLGNRRGDNAELAFLELTEKAEVKVTPSKSTATAKKSSVKPKAVKKETVSKESKSEEKVADKAQPQKAELKTSSKKDVTHSEKSKGSKKIVGGIKKMFNRKAGEK